MSHPDELLNASIRERRRLTALFTILILVVAGFSGTAWLLERARGDSWRDQALNWQGEYVSLYDEFTASTGEEPDAPDPSDVAQDAPEGEPGAQGPPGPAGASGKPGQDGRPGLNGTSITEAQLTAAIAQFCANGRCTGAAGTNGTNGTNGTDGAPGAASTIPGPVGPIGPAGPSGADGRGIQSLMCDDTTGRWTVTYTTGDVSDAGVCRVDDGIDIIP